MLGDAVFTLKFVDQDNIIIIANTAVIEHVNSSYIIIIPFLGGAI